MSWRQYSELKKIINQYWEMKDDEKYDEFIKKLTEILDI